MRWKKIALFSITLASLVVCSCENITKGLFSGVILRAAETISIGGGGVYKIPNDFKNNLNNPDGISVWTNVNNGAQSDELGRVYSGVLGKRPYLDGYATKGGDNQGSYRIPSITKVTLPNNKVRLICAFDVRYRGSFKGDGDVGQNTAGSDITVMYSDDEGETWTTAVNKKTKTIPAIDVENTYDGDGQTKSQSRQNTLDVCDPQLSVFPDGTIYCGMAAGSGNMGSTPNFRVFVSTDYGETWDEAKDSDADSTKQNTFFDKWGKKVGTGFFKTVLTTPGHGIILGKDVPGSPMFKQGQVVMPVFLNGNPNSTSNFGIYLATGTGNDPIKWNNNQFKNTFTQWKGGSQEESQVCQLDDGSLLLYGKCYASPGGDQFSRYRDNKWTEHSNTISSGKNCQAGLLKVADGDGRTKYGVVAFSYSGNSAANASSLAQGAGRGNITICLARDISAKVGAVSTDFPLDQTNTYYLKIRTKAQSYFGYTDMVMINENVLGIIYESYDSDQEVNGMRFLRIDIEHLINDLAKVN